MVSKPTSIDEISLGFIQETLPGKEGGETDWLEFKSILIESRPNKEHHRNSLIRTVVAFSNTDGGWIVFGVLDNAKDKESRANTGHAGG